MYVTVPLSYRNGTEVNSYQVAQFGDSGIPDWITAAGIPKLLDQDLIETRLGRDAAGRLAPLIADALRFWHEQVPLIDAEQLIGEKMACVAEPWAGLAAGTVVFLRDTTKARTAYVMPGTRIDLRTGVLSSDPEAMWRIGPLAAVHRPGPPQPGMLRAGAAAGGGTEVKAIVDGALTACTFVGFGIAGPWGLAFAGAAAVAEVLFNAFFNTGTPPLAQQVGDIVNRLLGKKEITDRANAIYTSLAVFQQNWNEMKTMDTRQITTLLEVAVHQVQDTNDLNQAINFLQGNTSVNFMDTEEMKRKVIALYGFAIAVKLLWIKVALLLDDSPEAKGNRVKSSYVHTMVTVGDAAIAHINTVMQAIEGAIAARGAKIGPCTAGAYTIAFGGSGGHTTACMAFQDPDNSWNSYTFMTDMDHFKEMVTNNSGCCYQYPEQETCNQKRNAYIAKVQGQVRDSYVYDQAAVASLRDRLAQVIGQYRPYLQH